jgi:hypothetical protein
MKGSLSRCTPQSIPLDLFHKGGPMQARQAFLILLIVLPLLGHTPVAHADEPSLVYETTIPGYYLSRGRDIAVDPNGNAYVIASWYENQANLDILVFKLDPDGNPVWTVPIVGDELEHDYASGIALDSQNNVWVTGWTDSDAFPTTPDALYPTHIHFRDAFLLKLDPDDGDILYGTYLGGDYTDDAEAILINSADEIYLVGTTGSTDFPTTPDAYQDEPSAPLYLYTDVFITRLSPDGTTILYSTYFGAFEDDMTRDAALDGQGNILFAGRTTAMEFPLVNPIQSTPNEIFVSKLSADGSTLLFSTYLGGEDDDGVYGLAVDSEGMVYITGQTRSILFPTTPGAFEEDFVGAILGCEESFPPVPVNCEDVFVTKMATDGSGLLYSTYLGGTTIDTGSDIFVDQAGCAHVVGYTVSSDFPGGSNTGAAIFVSKLDAAGASLLYTYTKESGSAGAGHGITVDDANDVYFTGADNVPADIYVAKLTDDVLDLTADLSGGELMLMWTPHALCTAHWVYGASNDAYFDVGFAPSYANRLSVLPAQTSSWSSFNGINDVENNWSYLVIAVDESEQELARSNTVGEHDFGLEVP